MNSGKIAVVQLILGKEGLSLHASIPYISTLSNTLYPYYRIEFEKQYKDVITQKVENIFRDKELGKEGRGFAYEKVTIAKNMDQLKCRKLYSVAKEITKKFDLDILFDFIFSLRNKDVTLLQIVTNDSSIPWDWICDNRSGELLCEVFGTGVIYSIESVHESLKSMPLTIAELNKTCKALIVGNTYSSQPGKKLPKMRDELNSIATKVNNIFGNENTIVCCDIERQQLGKIIQENVDKLKLIYFAGHFDRRGYCTEDENCHLTPEHINLTLNYCENKIFPSCPIVILNGCSTNKSTNNFVSSVDPSQNLAKSFLNAGSSACITTITDVEFEHAMMFAAIFFERYLMPGTSMGAAMLDARTELKAHNCYEWASYCLIGDPANTLLTKTS